MMDMPRDGRRDKSKMRKRNSHGFRGLILLLAVLVIALAVILPGSAARQQEEDRACEEASRAYLDAQNEKNRLRALLDESDSQDFVQRVARREYGYSLYGETIYVVSNLDELMDAIPFETAAQAETGD